MGIAYYHTVQIFLPATRAHMFLLNDAVSSINYSALAIGE